MSKKDIEYKEIFKGEALESYENLNNLFTDLEKDINNKSAVDAIFRITHTLKGNAMGMGFTGIAELSHVMEDVFNKVKQGEISLNDELFSTLFKANDKLGDLIDALDDDRTVSYKGIKTKLEVLLRNIVQEEELEQAEGGLPKEASEAPKAEATPEKKEEPKAEVKTEETKAEENATAEQSTSEPAVEATAEENNDNSEESDDNGGTDSSDDSQGGTPPLGDDPNIQAPNVNGGEKAKVEEVVAEVEVEEEEEEEKQEKSYKMALSDLVQVPVRKLDSLLNIVGELIIEKDTIMANGSAMQKSNDFARLHRITSDLQYGVMDIRLVQIGFLFKKFGRVVRDAAKLENKKVDLELEGTEIEIDRNILKIMSDSLVHLVRNSVGHGIEPPDIRKERGKSESGTITLKASNEKDAVLIEISDDGYGMDVERIKQKAIDKGLISKELANIVSKEEIIMCIFEPGFSSAEKVTEVSGRGVGMDVVKRATESIGGKIDVQTELGEGTTITLTLPSTMAVKGALLFELNKQEFAIALSYTEAVISLKKKDIHRVQNGLAATYLDQTISIVFLKDLFGLKSLKNVISESKGHRSLEAVGDDEKLEVLIVSYNGRYLGMVVDKLLQQKEIVEKTLASPVDRIELVSGATILGNGNICLVLDIARIVNTLFRESLTQLN